MVNPIIQYFGSKWRLHSRILSYFPTHKNYVECYGGTGIVLLNKPRCESEVYNDLNTDLVNLYTVVRDNPDELYYSLLNTDTTKEDFLQALPDSDDDEIEQAAKYFLRSRLSYGGQGEYYACTTQQQLNTLNSSIDEIFKTSKRLQGVEITCLPACVSYDKRTLIYADPPYIGDERSSKNMYKHEMTRHDHIVFLEQCLKTKAMVIISGYDSALYDEYLGEWTRVELDASVSYQKGSKYNRKEILWMNYLY